MKNTLIYCIELNKTFLTASAARSETGVDNSSISKACRGIRKTAGKHPITGEGLHWKYINLNEIQEGEN